MVMLNCLALTQILLRFVKFVNFRANWATVNGQLELTIIIWLSVLVVVFAEPKDQQGLIKIGYLTKTAQISRFELT